MKVVKDSESRPHKAVSFVVERESRRRCRNGMSKSCRRCSLPGYSRGRLPGGSTKEEVR